MARKGSRKEFIHLYKHHYFGWPKYCQFYKIKTKSTICCPLLLYHAQKRWDILSSPASVKRLVLIILLHVMYYSVSRTLVTPGFRQLFFNGEFN